MNKGVSVLGMLFLRNDMSCLKEKMGIVYHNVFFEKKGNREVNFGRVTYLITSYI